MPLIGIASSCHYKKDMATGYKKNGDYDLRTKKGKELKGDLDAAKAWFFRYITLPPILLIFLLLIIGEHFSWFG